MATKFKVGDKVLIPWTGGTISPTSKSAVRMVKSVVNAVYGEHSYSVTLKERTEYPSGCEWNVDSHWGVHLMRLRERSVEEQISDLVLHKTKFDDDFEGKLKAFIGPQKAKSKAKKTLKAAS